jgi:hypothetical protein
MSRPLKGCSVRALYPWFEGQTDEQLPETCQRCGYMSSNELCKACTLLEGLERGMANSGIVSSTDQVKPTY